MINAPKVPRRGRSCSRSGVPFQPGMEYLSLLREGRGDELIREDIALSWWKEHGSEEILNEAKSHWKGHVPLKSEAPKTPDEIFERAFELLESYMQEESPKAFLVALFLARKKRLILRQELLEGCMLYEVADTEEMLSIKPYEIDTEEMIKLQQELNHEIGSLS